MPRTPRRHRSGWRLQQALTPRYVVAAVAVIVIVLPVLYIVRLSAKPFAYWQENPHGFGGPWTTANFVGAFERASLDQAFVNSLTVVVPAALATTIVVAAAGFALGKLAPPKSASVFVLIAVGVGVPIPALILPLFIQGIEFGYAISRTGLVFVYTGLFSSWATYFMYSYYKSIPGSLIDAARVDGASNLRMFVHLGLPLARPALATVFLFVFLAGWNDLLVALVMLQRPDFHTVTVAVALLQSAQTIEVPLEAASLLIASIPPLIIVIAAQRFVATGLVSGAVKE